MNLRENVPSMDINILLEGREGLFMLEDAFELVSFLTSSENYELHPDYVYLDILKDKKSIGVDEVLPIIQRSYIKPVLLSKTIVVINNMDALTEAAQNKLLLSLEESPYLFVIGISYHNTLLPTIRSRMKKITYKPLSQKAFIDYCDGKYSAMDAKLLYYACFGCPGLLLSHSSNLELFQSLYQACTGGGRSDIFRALHLVKEKDKLSVFGEDRSLVASVFRVMQYGFMECSLRATKAGNTMDAVRYADIVKRLSEDELLLQNTTYSKENFFCTIMYCVEH